VVTQSYNPFSELIIPGLLAIIIGAIIGWLIILYRRKKTFLRLYNAKERVFFEVLIPRYTLSAEQETAKDFRETIAVAEQFLASLSSVFSPDFSAKLFGQPVFSLEIVAKEGEIRFFISSPREYKQMVERQIQSFYPHAQVHESKEFKIFAPGAEIAATCLKLTKKFILPIKTYRVLESDPLNNLTNVLSKLPSANRACIQILMRPINDVWRQATTAASRQISQGKGIATTPGQKALRGVVGFIGEMQSSTKPVESQLQKQEIPVRLTPAQEEMMQRITTKGAKVGFEAQVRIIGVAPSLPEANTIITNTLAGFAQFNDPAANSFKNKGVGKFSRFIVNFILRHFEGKGMIMNTEELASLYHFPSRFTQTPNIRFLQAKKAPPPANLSQEGIVLGKCAYRDTEVKVCLKTEDRRRHLYTIGMTGTGKSTFLENMILQDIKEGKGLCYIDPHGDTVEQILGKIPPERLGDVIYVDPADMEYPFGFNLLEWKTPEQKDFLVQETIAIFYKLFDPTQQGIVGPQFEHWLRNAALTVMAAPEGGTLIEIPRLFTDDAYRAAKIQYVQDPIVKAFWTQQLAKTAEFHKSEMYNYFISKFGRFMTNTMMRNIMGQGKSSIDIEQAMDQGKIILFNLSKGKLGEVNANLLGMILVAKIYSAAMARQKIPEEQRQDFYLYVDEFQNLATDTFGSILSEARKYRLNLVVANQYIAQLSEIIAKAILGNVGSIVIFRIGINDAEFLENQFAPVFDKNDLINIEKFNAYIKILIDNTPTQPFAIQTIKDETPINAQIRSQIIQNSRSQYAKERLEVEKEVGKRVKLNETVVTSSGGVAREGTSGY